MTTGRPEIHLFVLWEKARPQQERILADVRAQFEVLEVVRVTWRPEDFARHLTRFYGQSLPSGSEKERECGTGPFLLVVVRDREPRYGRRRQWGERVVVNTQMFDAKQRYRDWAGGGHRVHSTIRESETDHDLYVLLGRRTAFYRDAPRWDGSTIEHWTRPPVGTAGWESREQLLTAVEVTLGYVVLPDPDGDEHRLQLLVEGAWEHWGVEWLVAKPDPGSDRGRHYDVLVRDRSLSLELRHVGDDSFDRAWQLDMLRVRERDRTGAFALPSEERYWVLLYASLVHHPEPPAAALGRLAELSVPGAPLDPLDALAAKAALDRFLSGRGYSYVVPRDGDLFFNADLVGLPVPEQPGRRGKGLRRVSGLFGRR